MQDTPRTRAGRLPLAVALRRHLDLVHPHPRGRPELDPPVLVPEEDHAELSRRSRGATPGHLVRTNYNGVILGKSSGPLDPKLLDGMLDILATAAQKQPHSVPRRFQRSSQECESPL